MPIKENVIRDKLLITGNGIYCYLPYERLDKDNKAVMKIGITTDTFARRLEQYHTYYPLGVMLVAFLEVAPKKTGKGFTTYYKEIESFIFQKMKDLGAKQIESSTRIKPTEWFYCDEKQVKDAFVLAEKEFGGKLSVFHLKNLNRDANRLKQRKHYDAEIYYMLK
jgi:hypothetical protein